jgi:hypothetical protein
MEELSAQERRILDVNRNRITEALRVVEDVLRFSGDEPEAGKTAKDARHRVFRIFESIEKKLSCRLIHDRDSVHDRGRENDYDSSAGKAKSRLEDVMRRNLKRACEGLRVCEEITAKLRHSRVTQSFKKIRFLLYDMEKKLACRGKRNTGAQTE